MNDSDSTFSESESLHERLQRHLQNCSECLAVIQSKTKPLGLGMINQLCSEYGTIIQQWADEEGAANNIVAHDEFGNLASNADHTRDYPSVWRP